MFFWNSRAFLMIDWRWTALCPGTLAGRFLIPGAVQNHPWELVTTERGFYVISLWDKCHGTCLLSASAVASLNSQDVPCPRSVLFVQNLPAGGQDIWFGKASVSRGNLIHWHRAHVEHRVWYLALSRGFQSVFSMQPDMSLGQTL